MTLYRQPQTRPTADTATLPCLPFSDIDSRNMPRLVAYLAAYVRRSCDYTLRGEILWADLFRYRICETEGMMLISGLMENDLSLPAFSLPLGPDENTLPRAVELLRDCGSPLRFSAIPEDRLHLFAATAPRSVQDLGRDWSDYIYPISALATLSGNRLKRKRNHVNRFFSDHPGRSFAAMTPADAAECRSLLHFLGHDGSFIGQAEFKAVDGFLWRWAEMSEYFHGRVLRDGSGRIVSFTVGEVKDDTLHVHIEKTDHSVTGAGETINKLFCEEMLETYSRLVYVNRQDDAGDPGLRAAKESWRPVMMLPKFNVTYIK